MTKEDAKTIVGGTVDEVKAKLAGLSAAELGMVREAEMAGSSRSTLIAAIDAATGAAMTDGTPSGDDATPRPIVPADLTGKSLDQLETYRTLEMEHVGGDATEGDVPRVDAAIAALREAGAKAPEVDPGTTKSRTLPTRSTADALKAGPVDLILLDGARQLPGTQPLRLTAADFHHQHGHMVLQKAVRLAGSLPAGRLTHVALEDDDDQIVATCEIASVLNIGGGREAELPAGTLAF